MRFYHYLILVAALPIAAITGVALALGAWWLIMVQIYGALVP